MNDQARTTWGPWTFNPVTNALVLRLHLRDGTWEYGINVARTHDLAALVERVAAEVSVSAEALGEFVHAVIDITHARRGAP